jgi:hypothetical protein
MRTLPLWLAAGFADYLCRIAERRVDGVHLLGAGIRQSGFTLIDFMPMPDKRFDLIRLVGGERGSLPMRVELEERPPASYDEVLSSSSVRFKPGAASRTQSGAWRPSVLRMESEVREILRVSLFAECGSAFRRRVRR